VLVRKYLLGETWETIEKKMACGITTAKRWHNRAIEKLVKRSDMACSNMR